MRLRRSYAVAVCALAALLAPAVSAAAVETVATTSRPIVAVTQDQGRVAWITRNPFSDFRPYRVTVRHMRSGAHVSAIIGWSYSLEVPLVALGRGRAVYTNAVCGNACYWDVYTIALDDRRVRTVDGVLTSPGNPPNGGAGASVEAVAGDGETIAYAQVDWSYAVPTCDPQMDDCGPGLPSPGQVSRLAGTSPTAVPGATGDFLLAAGQGRVASAPGGQVQIRDAVTGSLISSFTPSDTIRALALDGGLAAVLLQGPGGKRIERYDAASGAFLASTAVPATTTRLDIAGKKLVFRSGNEIRLLEHPSGRVRLLLTAKTRPIGVSIEGTQVAWVKRVVWGVNRGRTGFVRSLRVS